jgi:hypothetical protein
MKPMRRSKKSVIWSDKKFQGFKRHFITRIKFANKRRKYEFERFINSFR